MKTQGHDLSSTQRIEIVAKLRLINLLDEIGLTECVATMLDLYHRETRDLTDPAAAELLVNAETWLADAVKSENQEGKGSRLHPQHPVWSAMTRFRD